MSEKNDIFLIHFMKAFRPFQINMVINVKILLTFVIKIIFLKIFLTFVIKIIFF